MYFDAEMQIAFFCKTTVCKAVFADLENRLWSVQVGAVLFWGLRCLGTLQSETHGRSCRLQPQAQVKTKTKAKTKRKGSDICSTQTSDPFDRFMQMILFHFWGSISFLRSIVFAHCMLRGNDCRLRENAHLRVSARKGAERSAEQTAQLFRKISQKTA